MVDAFGLSDAGSVRANNEDYFVIDREAGIFVLADGMGGAQAGERAAQLGAERLYGILRESGPESGIAALENAFDEANEAVLSAARSNPDFEGMGTTLIAVRMDGDCNFLLGSVGDSRAYLVSGGQIRQLTHDQTWVAEVGPRLGLTSEGMRNHPMRHVLTMAVGCADELRVDSQSVVAKPGDQVLLCSDGLHGVVEERFIAATVKSEKSLEEKCHFLVEAAKDRGGPDNVTVVLIRLE